MGRTRKKGQNITGWLVLDKPLGQSSTQALGKARYLLDAKKAGHAGTLDPLASGVLPLAFGEATKTIPFMVDAQKTYTFTIAWGASTTTLDAEGEVTERSDVRPTQAEIMATLPGFIGQIEQIPPAFSAIKVDGKRAYALARAGEEVALAARTIRIDALVLQGLPDADHACFEVQCGKGTYVRSLMRDLAAALGAKGHISALRRTQVGAFDESASLSIETLAGMNADERMQALLPLDAALSHLPAIDVSLEQAQDLRHGRAITPSNLPNGPAQSNLYAHQSETPVAIGMLEDGFFKPGRVFNLP
jgi:tRNA pseudouridine55 synthase